jgi:hypothetical protein
MITIALEHRIWFLNINNIDSNMNLIINRFLLNLVKKIMNIAISPGRVPGMQFFQDYED